MPTRKLSVSDSATPSSAGTVRRIRRPWTRCYAIGTAWSRSTHSRKNTGFTSERRISWSRLRFRPASYQRVSSLQACGGCPGHHLENPPGGRAGMAQTQCAGVAATRRLRCAVQRWEADPVRQCDGQRERSGREDRRLNPIYTLIDMTSHDELSWPE